MIYNPLQLDIEKSRNEIARYEVDFADHAVLLQVLHAFNETSKRFPLWLLATKTPFTLGSYLVIVLGSSVSKPEFESHLNTLPDEVSSAFCCCDRCASARFIEPPADTAQQEAHTPGITNNPVWTMIYGL
jgi:hypothetical protein